MIEITLLTKDDCNFCEQAKDALDRVGCDYEIRVELLDLESPEGASAAQAAGAVFAPVVLVEGEAFSQGRLSERKLRRHLDKHHPA